jgi:hypothetical protein
MPSSRAILAQCSTFREAFAIRLSSRASFESFARALKCWRASAALWFVTHSSKATARQSHRLAVASALVSSVVRALRCSAATSFLFSLFA